MLLRILAPLAIASATFAAGACGSSEPDYEPRFESRHVERVEYSFAVHPLHNPVLLVKTYAPLMEYLNARVPDAKFRLVASQDYAAYGRRLAAREFDFALPNPYQAVQATGFGYRIFGKVAGDERFHGMILVRRNSPIRHPAQFRGKTISYPAPTAVAATMLPQYFLQTHGASLKATRPIYVGSMESAIESVRSGSADGGATWPDPWEKYSRAHPKRASELEVRWVTRSLVNNALIVRDSVPAAVADRVLAALRNLDSFPAGRRLLDQLSVKGFEPADDAAYDPVRKFLRDFAANVRPLPPLQGES
jgi:phosphonate transport system substrate-binding protein